MSFLTLSRHITRRSVHTTNARITRDPLLSSPAAKHYILPDGTLFIVRTPPSAVPPTLPLSPLPPPASNPNSSLTHPLSAASSPKISSQAEAETYLPPVVRPNKNPKTGKKDMSVGLPVR
ncbi:hypothetical protein BT69DRAFT_1332456 [Atractiella rhizophila]|nr:hypothetical protein BT69DRAFT_1332456 [Atractiella rhizophila]